MSKMAAAVIIFLAAIVCVPARGAAQEPVASFDQLTTRLKVGDRIWVIDAGGRKTYGRIQSLSTDALIVDADGPKKFTVSNLKLIQAHKRDSLKNGTLIGLAVGGSLAAVWCTAAAVSNDPNVDAGVECAEGLISFAGLGTLLGLGLDALTPGKGPVVYRSSGASGAARFSIAPFLTPRKRGIVVSFAFGGAR